MTEYFNASGLALWLGILTSISPCPLATNIAAVSYLSKNVGSKNPYQPMLVGLIYIAGRMLTYAVLAMIFLSSLEMVPEASFFLQNNMNKILGPVLLFVGVVLLEWIRFPSFGGGIADLSKKGFKKGQIIGALIMGAGFALSFCPISAALYFGSLLPLALKHNSSLVMPSLYGIGTGLPVFLFSIVLLFGIQYVARLFDKVKTFELWARRVTGIIFIGVGAYYTWLYIIDPLLISDLGKVL